MLREIKKIRRLIMSAIVVITLSTLSLCAAENKIQEERFLEVVKTLELVNQDLNNHHIVEAQNKFTELKKTPNFGAFAKKITLNDAENPQLKLFYEVVGKMTLIGLDSPLCVRERIAPQSTIVPIKVEEIVQSSPSIEVKKEVVPANMAHGLAAVLNNKRPETLLEYGIKYLVLGSVFCPAQN